MGINSYYAKGRLKSGKLNKTETLYSIHLEHLKDSGSIIWYKFEGMKLKLADNCFYTPDFVVLSSDSYLEFHEIKGSKALIMDDAKVKIKVAAELYPFKFLTIVPNKAGGWETISVI